MKMKSFFTLASLAFACNAFAGGYFETATAFDDRTDHSRVELTGWACDLATPDHQGWIHFWRENGEFLGALPANIPREPAVGAACGGNHVHGFSGSIFLGSTRSMYRQVRAYFIPLNGTPFELSQSPMMIKVEPYQNPCAYYPGVGCQE